jgi:hypothetical protein
LTWAIFISATKRQVFAQVDVTWVAGLDGGDFALAEQPQKIPQSLALKRDVMRGEKTGGNPGSIGFVF